ncbi:hypothetical protein XENORESO_020353 [Xenotaenia resolanae]|uniref:Uncharacterized protein n=1 Tax=Xenotaenia resolanae TaxID=208358 RepID=A0ABV0VZT2_9TELE
MAQMLHFGLNAGFLPKVASAVSHSLPLHFARFVKGDASEFLCPVQALETYTERQSLCANLIAFLTATPGPTRGSPPCLVEQTFSIEGHHLTAGVRCHSTKSLNTSLIAMTRVSLETICAAASWTSRHFSEIVSAYNSSIVGDLV